MKGADQALQPVITPPMHQFVHMPDIGCLRVSDISGWWWVEVDGAMTLEIGLRDKRCVIVSDAEKAKAFEALLLAAVLPPA